MKIYLRDINQNLVNAWRKYFDGAKDVFISEGDIFADGEHMKVDAIVSPANSFGYMDGGIDYVYSEFFGWEMSKELRNKINECHDGELLVGQATVVDIQNSNPKSPIKYLISAPTMRVPMDISNTVNAYLAFKAVLRTSLEFDSILCPGLGTAIGKMPCNLAAIQMRCAYNEIIDGQNLNFVSLAQYYNKHHMMIGTDVYRFGFINGQVKDRKGEDSGQVKDRKGEDSQ